MKKMNIQSYKNKFASFFILGLIVQCCALFSDVIGDKLQQERAQNAQMVDNNIQTQNIEEQHLDTVRQDNVIQDQRIQDNQIENRRLDQKRADTAAHRR